MKRVEYKRLETDCETYNIVFHDGRRQRKIGFSFEDLQELTKDLLNQRR